jgi:ATP-dependent Clp protease protease subunit
MQPDKDKIGNFYKSVIGNKKFYFDPEDVSSEDTAKSNATNYTKTSEEKNITLSDISTTRSVYLFDRFDQDSSQKLVSELVELDSINNDDITIYINSYGGEVYSLNAILDTIDGLKSTVNTVCLGIAASCGAVLFAYGSSRYIGNNSKAMIHEVSGVSWGSITEMEEMLEEARGLNDRIASLISSSCNQDVNAVKKIMKKDTYLDAANSIEFGIADHIIGVTEKELETLNVKNRYRNSKGTIDMVLFESLKNKASKGATPMPLTKEQLLVELSNTHGINVLEIQNSLTEANNKVQAMTSKVTELQNELESSEKEKKEVELNTILNSLITEGKASQKTNVINKLAFQNMSIEDVKKYTNEMPVLIKVTADAESPTNDEDLKEEEKTQLSIVTDFLVANKLELTDANYAKHSTTALNKNYNKKGN